MAKHEWQLTATDEGTGVEVYEAVVPIVGDQATNDKGENVGDIPTQYERYVPGSLTPKVFEVLLGEFKGRSILAISAGENGVTVRLSGLVCPKCEEPVSDTDKFCPNCGEKLSGGDSQ